MILIYIHSPRVQTQCFLCAIDFHTLHHTTEPAGEGRTGRPRLFIFYRDRISQKKRSNIFTNKNNEISPGKILGPKLPPMSEWFNKWIVVLWECGLETWQIMQAFLPLTGRNRRRQNVQRQEMIRWHGEYSTKPFSHVRESRKSYEAWQEMQPGSWSREPTTVTCSLLRTHPWSADDAHSLLPCSRLISGWLHDAGTLTRRLEMCSWRSWLYLGRNRQLGLGEIGWQVAHETV